MADQLATPSDLASLLQSDVDTATATLLIECATAVVQAVAEQRIVEVEDDEVTLTIEGTHRGLWLDLPERPVTAVGVVEIGDTAVIDWSEDLRRGRLWRADGWRSTLTAWYDEPSTVTVTYTHGYPTGHQRLQFGRSVALGLARAVYAVPTGATQVRIDDYSEAYEAMSARMEASPFLVKALKRQYGRLPGSVVLVAT